MNTSKNTLETTRILGLTCLVGVLGCDTDASDDPDSADGTETDAPATGGGVEDRSAVMLSVRVRTPDNRIFYVGAFPEIPTGELDLTKLREFSGPSDATTFNGHVYVSDQESGVMTRFDVDDDLQLVEGPTISFANYGVSGYMPPAYIDENRAYILGPQFDTVVVWDPSTMEITGTLDMTPPEMSGFVPAGDGRPSRVGDHMAWDFNGVDWDSLDYHREATVLLAPVDGSEAPVVARDDRCMFGTFHFLDDEGDLYFFATGYRGYNRFYGPRPEEAPPFCVLRINEGETDFDPDYMLDLEQVTGSPAVHGMWPIEDHKFLLLVWPPEVPLPENADDIWTQRLEPMLLDLDTETATPFTSMEPSPAGNVRRLELDGEPYFQMYSDDGEEVQFGPLTLDSFTPKFTTRGDVLAVGRIR